MDKDDAEHKTEQELKIVTGRHCRFDGSPRQFLILISSFLCFVIFSLFCALGRDLYITAPPALLVAAPRMEVDADEHTHTFVTKHSHPPLISHTTQTNLI